MSLTPYNDAFSEMDRMMNAVRRRMQQLAGPGFGDWPTEGGVQPLALDLVENEDSFTVRAAVPGVSEDQVDVRVDNNVLTIEAETRYEHDDANDEGWHIRELRYGRVSRSLSLPAEIVVDDTEAELDNGILTITLPKAQPSPIKRIAVKARSLLSDGDNGTS